MDNSGYRTHINLCPSEVHKHTKKLGLLFQERLALD